MREGWEITRINEVCDILNGGTPKTNVKEFWDGEILWITPKDMGKLQGKYVDNTFRKITEAGLKNSSAKVLPPNSIILSSRAPIGHLAINQKPITTNQGCKGLVPKENIDVAYLFYFLSNSIEMLNSIGTGATFKELSGSTLGKVNLPLPPLPEQQRIVSILDEAFSAIDKAKANYEQNLKNAKELFESYLEDVFSASFVQYKELFKISKIVNGFAFASRDFNAISGVRTVKITNVGVKEFICTEDFLPQQFALTSEACKVHAGDIVIALTRTIISSGVKVALVHPLYDGALVNQRVAAIVPNGSLINRDFLYYYFTTLHFKNYVLSNVNELMQPNLSIKDLKNTLIPCPPIEEQDQIVTKFNILQVKTKKLEAIYTKKIKDLDELKKALLQKAFSGELTANQLVEANV